MMQRSIQTLPLYPLAVLVMMVSMFIPRYSISDTALSSMDVKYDKLLTGYEYPYPVKQYGFQSQGLDLQMSYMYLPPSQQGAAVVVLLHGKNFNGAYWEQVADYLQKQGYGVLIPDQIGFGKSSKPINYQYSFAALAHNTHGLLQSLDIERPVVVGHSMGGMLASRFALLYPESTQRLILVNPIGLENYLRYVEYKDINFFYRNEMKAKAQSIIAYQKQNYYDGQWNPQYEALTKPLVGWIQGPDWSHLAQVNALTYDMIFTQPVIEEFKNFSVPVALILGTRDRTGPGRKWKKPGVSYELGRYDQLGAKVKARNSSIMVTELDGLGHLPQIEDFGRFSKAFSKVLH